MLTSVLKHQDGGMYKTPTYPGYPFLMLPDPYLPNGSVSPSVSTPNAAAVCQSPFVSWWLLVRPRASVAHVTSKSGASGSVPQEEAIVKAGGGFSLQILQQPFHIFARSVHVYGGGPGFVV